MPSSARGASTDARRGGGKGHRRRSRASPHARLEAVASPRSLTRGRGVREALGGGGADLGEITYTFPRVIGVRGGSQEVSEGAVRQILEAFLGEALGAGAADGELKSVEVPGAIRIRAGAYTTRVVPPLDRPLLGRVRLGVEVALDGPAAEAGLLMAGLRAYRSGVGR